MEVKGIEPKQRVTVAPPHERIDMTVFKNGFTSKVKQQIIKKDAQKMIKQGEWDLSSSKYKFDKWALIFEWIESAGCNSLNLKKNFNQQIIKQISAPAFTALILLDLESNKISNVETLAFLDTPVLEVLKMRHNYVLDLKTMNKTNWKGFVQLDLSINPIKKLDLSRVEMGEKNFKMTLESREYGDNFVEDLNVLVKLKIITVSRIMGSSNTRIYQKQIPKMVKKRWPVNSIAFFKDFLIY